ncbi:MAG: VWA domain-containing protein [Planctomycetes bacterium]|nr:VWA domain-containing protein [Planctomycetota bacterium]
MSFTVPLYFAFAAAIPVVVLLYFLKLKREDFVISSTLLWRKCIDEMRVNSPFQRLRRNLLLLLQIIILALLVLALARPFRSTEGIRGVNVILLVDNSASMSATDVRPSRLEHAKSLANDLIDDMKAEDNMMIMSFADQPVVACTFTSSKTKLREAVAAVKPTELPTRITDALRIARALALSKPPSEIVLLSDGGFDESKVGDLKGASCRYIGVGKRSENVGITAIDVRRLPEKKSHYQAFVKVQNFGADTRRLYVQLIIDGKLADAREVVSAPGGASSIVFDIAGRDTGVIEARFDLDDDLQVDNAARAVLKTPEKVKIALVTNGNYFLERALALEENVEVVRFGPRMIAGGKLLDAPEYDMVIFDGCAPKELDPGKYLFMNAAPPLPEIAFGPTVKAPIIIDWNRRHAANRFITYGNVQVAEARTIKGGTSLLDTKQGPIMAALDRGDIKLIAVGFDIYKSNWPLRISYPVFISNTIRYLVERVVIAQKAQLKSGETITINLAKAADKAALTDPAGGEHELKREGNADQVFFPADRCGIYRASQAGAADEIFAVNLTAPRESDTTPREALSFGGFEVKRETEKIKMNQELWRLFALLGFAFLMLEWWVYNRRVYV